MIVFKVTYEMFSMNYFFTVIYSTLKIAISWPISVLRTFITNFSLEMIRSIGEKRE